jgi:hypothetical protein
VEIKAQWWLEDERPIIEADIGGVKVNLTRREGEVLANEVWGCLNGIVEHLARYYVLSGWGKKEHLAIKDGYTEQSPALCGTKPRSWVQGEPGKWSSDRVLRSAPDRHYICARCFAKYEKLEAA